MINKKYEIKIMPSSNLIIPSKQIDNFTDKLKELVMHMYGVMINDGIGLAAPQIGVNLSCVVLNSQLNDDKLKDAYIKFDNINCYALFNLKIISKKEDYVLPNGEGCLSVPSNKKSLVGKVNRAKHIKVEYQDIHGKHHIQDLLGLTSVILQHEFDHINGILFVHRMKNQNSAKELAILIAQYSIIHNLMCFQKEIANFIEYGLENIKNESISMNINESEMKKLCIARNLPNNITQEIFDNINYFDTISND